MKWMPSLNKLIKKLICLILLFVVSGWGLPPGYAKPVDGFTQDEDYQEYMDFFEEVYSTVENNYYQEVKREQFDRFIKQFNEKIYGQLKGQEKSSNFIKWRSAAFLIDALKTAEDIFSAFYPPEPAKEYEETALGVRIDLGIEGKLVEKGYQTTQVEPRSDAYSQGLRIDDLIVQIDGEDVTQLTVQEVQEKLVPLVDSKVQLRYLSHVDLKPYEIEVISKEYFKQTVFIVETNVPHIYCLDINRFNRKTSEDIFRFLEFFRQQGPIKGLIIDLRSNPGGPPLAARELSSFFLTPGEEFAYFQKRGQPKASLDVPEIPEQFRYSGPLVILIDKKSGSSSELFSGILQRRQRAVLMGENSAGQVMLKSMFHFDDESMVLLITGRGHHPDGHVFSFGGLVPDRYEQDIGEDVLGYATKYLIYVNQKGIL